MKQHEGIGGWGARDGGRGENRGRHRLGDRGAPGVVAVHIVVELKRGGTEGEPLRGFGGEERRLRVNTTGGILCAGHHPPPSILPMNSRRRARWGENPSSGGGGLCSLIFARSVCLSLAAMRWQARQVEGWGGGGRPVAQSGSGQENEGLGEHGHYNLRHPRAG